MNNGNDYSYNNGSNEWERECTHYDKNEASSIEPLSLLVKAKDLLIVVLLILISSLLEQTDIILITVPDYDNMLHPVP